ncbi:MAG: sugar phosphate isomerase/epimerase [Gammaproteobacteria bacterium]|uniref:sugar phosphate isomerase/epimerase family protein n=1 Tax=Rhodoferax sp. TaxID=50421 RepID=UPI0017B18E62|nr:glutamine ABC transporter ATP-binding protein [Rhodoferax sp.]MBU3899423.1 sugar phosphate isomerase/epimerase [Gammaproteobacteria bacterium]MBA3057276.1 TIM barrel protein [Rhodoferax sp.]MBU3996327.1 sugar phosphate isomerase/epimerase [Gammaproteobacteria bacterium]MBU4080678.1 sugar phosphate isomerase/epimerase [Gammaproteobacteria bacterium]MBU4113532.1 sugar phosphate isomerase/epimerase [Gammaproteobacteria bacterium]
MAAHLTSVTSTTQPPTPVLISLSAFGAAEVRRHGQQWFSALSLAAGADGVEVRSELLVEPARELPAIAQAVRTAGKSLVFSDAHHLWGADGTLNMPALERALAATQTLGAARLKMAIGGFGPTSHRSLDELQARLQASGTELLIENDQTAAAGTLAALQDFFSTANAQGLFLGMTFDMGNWHWTGECPLQAAAALAPQVRYVHCKGVQRLPQRWVAVPLTESGAPWRAVLRALPTDVPWAIEYPLAGDDLLNVTRREIEQLRGVAASTAGVAPARRPILT